ncbi:MAG: hypothetical protein Q8O89_02325 [Nanoarchaeota archaeon]|nr:hypothetical protein [Nanoarchaeota archaeon]
MNAITGDDLERRVSFKELDTKGGLATIGGMNIPFKFETCNVDFSLDENGQIEVYAIAENTPGLAVSPLRMKISVPTGTNGAYSAIFNTLSKYHEEYRARINEEKEKTEY